MHLEPWLWTVTAVLALPYLAIGLMKATRPIPVLAGMIRWPGDVPPAFVRSVGVSEILGAFGLVLPVLTGVLVLLAPLAAICLGVIQILAIGFHLARGETRQTLGLNLGFLALSSVVAWGQLSAMGA